MKSSYKSKNKQRASILIVVLWIISISLVLISILVSNTRLSATIVMRQQEALENWAKMLSVISQVKMELLLQQSYSTAALANVFKAQTNNNINSDKKDNLYNGEKIKLSYPGNNDLFIRIYDLSGKLNLSTITRTEFKKILQKKLGSENQKVDELLDAWQDWIDNDNFKRINGAEKTYYSQKELPYLPRNAPLQSVNELNLIKGFHELFGIYDYTKVFSLYGVNRSQINPNIANKETLLLIPGIDEKLADEIIVKRKQQPFVNMAEFNALIPANVASKTKGWFALSKSRFFAIVIYPKQTENDAIINKDGFKEIYVYKEIVQKLGQKSIKTLRVFPSYKIRL
jgi:general secretion pathway protein K